jgi:diguanylate cyclase (GGDEF)-like protein/PAS domain S-box-containing protein
MRARQKKTEALEKILGFLDRRESVTVGGLARTLEVSERTASRYVDELKADYPVVFDPSKKSYRFADGYTLHSEKAVGFLAVELVRQRKTPGSSALGIAAYRFDGRCVFANDALSAIVGAKREDILSQNFTKLRSWEDSGLLALARKVMETGVEERGDFHFSTSFGKVVWLGCTISPFERNKENYLFIVVEDKSDRLNAERQLLTLAAAIDHSPNMIIITGADGCIEYVNPKFTQATGYEYGEVAGKNPGLLGSGETSPEILEDLWSTVKGGGDWRGELCNRKKNGETYWVEASVSPVFGPEGGITNFVAIETDITKRKLEHDQLYLMATTDPLTGVSNRRMILDVASREFALSRRHKRALSILGIDVDHFKNVNDSYGHFVGDEVLRHITSAIAAHLRNTDAIGRTGGEEFIVVLPEANYQSAILIAEKLRNRIEKSPAVADGLKIPCKVSIGATSFRPEDTDLEQLLQRTDRALYQAKIEGRNRVCYC